MRQFWTIFKFELKTFFENKVFLGVTAVLVALSAIVMYVPKFLSSSFFSNDTNDTTVSYEEDVDTNKDRVLLVADWDALQTYQLDEELVEGFSEIFPSYQIVKEDKAENIEERIRDGSLSYAFVFPSENIGYYTYYVNDISLYDHTTDNVDAMLKNRLVTQKFVQEGVDANKVQMYMNLSISHDTVNLGEDQSMNFFYTYLMIMALYMVIAMYGQMVATRVAAEKDSRAMELLIASAKPTALMFGKVLSSCVAGLVQIGVIFGSAIFFYRISGASSNAILSILFDIPLSLLAYMLLFFLLGYLLYAFLFGAIASTVSKTEDLSSAITPVTMLFVIAFMIVMFSMSADAINSPLMKFCSYFPFTSPMAMFARIAMSHVPFLNIAISVAILLVTVALIGRLAGKIYRVGVLMYGQKSNLFALIKQILFVK